MLQAACWQTLTVHIQSSPKKHKKTETVSASTAQECTLCIASRHKYPSPCSYHGSRKGSPSSRTARVNTGVQTKLLLRKRAVPEVRPSLFHHLPQTVSSQMPKPKINLTCHCHLRRRHHRATNASYSYEHCLWHHQVPLHLHTAASPAATIAFTNCRVPK